MHGATIKITKTLLLILDQYCNNIPLYSKAPLLEADQRSYRWM